MAVPTPIRIQGWCWTGASAARSSIPGIHKNRNDEYWNAVSDIEQLYVSDFDNVVLHSNMRILYPMLLHPI